MLTRIFTKIFGSRNQRLLNQMNKVVKKINGLEEQFQALSDEQLAAKTDEFRKRYQGGEKLDALMAEAFATVRETSRRVMGMRHFDVQLIGGMALHSGKIAEMRTGEGKTLMSTLAAYLNALSGDGVHVITVNDYLAKRDAEWMMPIYHFLGMTVGINLANMSHEQKKAAYDADITYGTNNEYGFDYLRDNMAFSLEQKVQRELNFAIVDEVDSILIDEARTPLIISGPSDESSDLYTKINQVIPKLVKQEEEDGPGDYSLDEKAKQAHLTEQGHETIEQLLLEIGLLHESESLYDVGNISLMHHVSAALRAYTMYQRDVDYIVANNEVVIVDEHTGRTMPGRRWSDGLHQAVEAKEGVVIRNENQTLASITFQNYFRLYDKLSGMTGTADTEAYEFQQIYGLEVVVIPTNKPNQRKDLPDQIYLSAREKFNAVIDDIVDCQKRQQPVLVGAASIETSEFLSALLKKQNISHQVLNAKFHEKEAHIIAQAGRPSTVTIATNMAGRGTDIVLGGSLDAEIAELGDGATQQQIDTIKSQWQQRHDQVINAGGLHILGSERHESRRIDNQLRGRSGRQGDPGSSRFYLSLEDDLMRIFASERVANIMQKLGMKEGEAIEHGLVTKAIENAQRKVEGRNFDIRKQLLEFDDVANDQRKVVYEQRSIFMAMDDVTEMLDNIRADVINDTISQYMPVGSLEEMWDVPGLEKALETEFGLKLPIQKMLDEDDNLHEENLRHKIVQEIEAILQAKEEQVTAPVMRQFEKSIMLQTLDQHWKDHLSAMDYLRQGIHLRGYAQKNPKQEYKRESFELFSSMLSSLKHEVIKLLCLAQFHTEEELQAMEQQRQQQAMSQSIEFQHASVNAMQDDNQQPQDDATAAEEPHQPYVRNQPKVGRNEPCPCGSGKKYKQCHGKLA